MLPSKINPYTSYTHGSHHGQTCLYHDRVNQNIIQTRKYTPEADAYAISGIFYRAYLFLYGGFRVSGPIFLSELSELHLMGAVWSKNVPP